MDISFLIIFLVVHLLPSSVNTASIHHLGEDFPSNSLIIQRIDEENYTTKMPMGEVRKYKVKKYHVIDYSQGEEKIDLRLFLAKIPKSHKKWKKAEALKVVDEPSDILIQRSNKKIRLSQKEGSFSSIFPFEISWQ
jgi:hypothetical protein